MTHPVHRLYLIDVITEYYVDEYRQELREKIYERSQNGYNFKQLIASSFAKIPEERITQVIDIKHFLLNYGFDFQPENSLSEKSIREKMADEKLLATKIADNLANYMPGIINKVLPDNFHSRKHFHSWCQERKKKFFHSQNKEKGGKVVIFDKKTM